MMDKDYGVILTEQATAEPLTISDLIEVLECVHDEISMAEQISSELGLEVVTIKLQSLRLETRALTNNLPLS